MDITIGEALAPPPGERGAELVERKGRGHPDTMCDGMAERLSTELCRFYVKEFGRPLHHNVDKVLLRAGVGRPEPGGGELEEPVEVYLSGRATHEFRGHNVPVEQIVREACRDWVDENLHAADPGEHFRFHNLLRPGSPDLVQLFDRQFREGRRLANDTSVGVGYAPASVLEQLVLDVERRLSSDHVTSRYPALGEDVKVSGLRRGDTIELTVACAMIGRFTPTLERYERATRRAAELARETAREHTGGDLNVQVNTADRVREGEVYLTVLGTSADGGDDGQTGRGNRVGGLITPYRPMVMEAPAGKNPVSHPGKLYPVAANRIARRVAGCCPGVEGTECYLQSRIGQPLGEPQLLEVRLHTAAGSSAEDYRTRLEEVADEELGRLEDLWREILEGELGVALF